MTTMTGRTTSATHLMLRQTRRWRHMIPLILAFTVAAGTFGCDNSPAEVRTPQQFMSAMGESLQHSKLDKIWNALPPSYRSDLEQIVHNDFPKIHPQTWQHVLTMGQNLEKLISERREILLQSMLVAQNDQLKKLIREHGDETVALLAELRTGPLADPKSWSTMDVEEFVGDELSRTLAVVITWSRTLIPQFGDAFDQLANNETVIIKEEPERILAKVQAPGAAPQEQFFVKVAMAPPPRYFNLE